MNRKLEKKSKEQAFRMLFEQYYAPFCLYAKRFIENKEEREDIVSDVFATLWDKIEWGEVDINSTTLLGYIKMCVKNNCLNYLKHQEYEWEFAEKIQKLAPIYDENYDSVYTLDELYRMLYETLQQMPESYREVFKKSVFQDKTQVEIAKEMNLSLKTIGRYKQKVMEILQLKFKDYLPLIFISLIHKNIF